MQAAVKAKLAASKMAYDHTSNSLRAEIYLCDRKIKDEKKSASKV